MTCSTGGRGLLSATPAGPPAAARRVAELIGPELGWDPDRVAAEADAYAAEVLAQLTRAGLDPAPAPGPTRPAATVPAAEGA